MERLKIGQNILIDEATIKEMENAVFDNLKAVKYLRQLGLSDELIKENITKIYDFAIDMQNCKDCKGLNHCNKEPKYLVSSVTFNKGIVDRVIVPCKKYLEYTNFKKRFVTFDAPEEWMNNTLTGDVSNIRSKKKMAILRQYTDVLKGNSNKWLFIKGGIATGKSFYAATICVDAAKAGAFEKICFINVPSKFKELSDLAFTKNPQFEEDMDKYKNAGLLVFDDFGNEFKSDFVRDNILYPLLSYRVKNKLFTIITSNYSIEDCASMYQTTNASKPKIEQIRQMLKMMCDSEFLIVDPSLE